MSTPILALGVHLAAGVTWLAPVSTDGDLVDDRTDRLEFAGRSLSPERALAELEESLEQLFRRLQPNVMALLKAGTSSMPRSPSDLLRRGWLEGALMIAAHRTGPELAEVTHAAVKSRFGIRPTDKDFQKLMSERISCVRPPKWSDRALAFGAALVAIEAHG